MKSASEYWKERFGEEPKSVNDRLMCAMMREYAEHYQEEMRQALSLGAVSTRFLILSGEGGHQTEHQFVMELNTLEEANEEFDKLKKGEFDGTYLYIYEAKKLREE